MTKENDFKEWLAQSSAQTEAGRSSRCYAVRTIERNLAALGMLHESLDEAWKADRFVALRDRLRKMQEDARAGGQDYRLLMPDSNNPHNRLSSWGSWLGQYGRFLAGDPPEPAKDAGPFWLTNCFPTTILLRSATWLKRVRTTLPRPCPTR